MAIKNIVYILGAGFSAPLGLPVMSNFIEKAKDIHFNNPSRFPHIKSIMDSINKLSKVKSFGQLNLFNIEEVLSFLEMEAFFVDENLLKQYKEFLADVINFYTPNFSDIQSSNYIRANFQYYPFNQGLLGRYSLFVANLIQCYLLQGEHRIFLQAPENKSVEYSVVTLNYDLVIENCLSVFKKLYDINFNIELPFAKLHGSADDPQKIIPPTWNKVTSEEKQKSWKLAYDKLSIANEIRIIGYSLPTSDNYLKFLLLNGFQKNDYLSKIDIICFDPTGDVRKRYGDFLCYPNVRFFHSTTEKYLISIGSVSDAAKRQPQIFNINFLEEGHNEFVRSGHSDIYLN